MQQGKDPDFALNAMQCHVCEYVSRLLMKAKTHLTMFRTDNKLYKHAFLYLKQDLFELLETNPLVLKGFIAIARG